MNTQKNLNFLQKPLCPSFTQLLIKFSQMNFLRVYTEENNISMFFCKNWLQGPLMIKSIYSEVLALIEALINDFYYNLKNTEKGSF